MVVSSDIEFIGRDPKKHRNGEACRASPACFWSSLINLISKDTYVIFYLSRIISRFNGEKTAKQMCKPVFVVISFVSIRVCPYAFL